MTSRLLNTAIALPDHVYRQDEIQAMVSDWLGWNPEQAAKAEALLANAGVDRRYTVRPAEWYLEHTSVTERSQVYREEMIRLCEQAAWRVLDQAGIAPQQIGLIISTSCTGLMIPSVESYLMNRMPFRPTTRRQPMTALGCAAGAAAVNQADDFLKAHPGQAVLILSAELASLTGQVSDFSMANIVSVALFGDGAAAAVVAGEDFATPPVTAPAGDTTRAGHLPARILATRSVLFPQTENMMGFDNTDTGLKIFLLPKVPRFLRKEIPRILAPFLEENDLRLRDLTHFLIHPGGRKVLEGLQEKLSLEKEQVHLSWKVLSEYGNLSSATVLFLLHHLEREATPGAGEYGLMLAVGPGFSAEMAILQW